VSNSGVQAARSGRGGFDQATTEDSLGFEHYVEAVYQHLTDPHTHPPVTLSVEGEWGSGKSSFMLQLRQRIRKGDADAKIVWFNAWRHDKDKAVWAAFAVEFARRLILQRKPDRAFARPWRDEIRRLQDAAGGPDTPSLRTKIKAAAKTALRWLGDELRWLCWRGKTAWHLKSMRFDWDRGWWDLLRTAAVALVWVALVVAAWNLDKLPGKLADIPFMAWLTRCGAVLGMLSSFAAKFAGNPFRYNLRKYMRKPNYDDEIAFIEKFHEDFDRVIKAYAGNSRIYVFIDDLDRCDVPKAADLMQALNLMIADDTSASAPQLVYILGLDRQKVAAGLAVKFKELMPYLDTHRTATTEDGSGPQPDVIAIAEDMRRRGIRFGYNFIEKFVQLPFLVPRPQQGDIDAFTESMFLATEAESSERVPPMPKRLWAFLKQLVPSRNRDESPADDGHVEEPATHIREEVVEDAPKRLDEEEEPLSDGPTESTLKTEEEEHQADQEWQQFLADPAGEQMRGFLRMVAPAFANNPRRLKQFAGLLRLRARIYYETSLADLTTVEKDRKPRPGIWLAQLAKFVAIGLRWPLLLNDLQDNYRLLDQLIELHEAMKLQEESKGEHELTQAQEKLRRREARWLRSREPRLWDLIHWSPESPEHPGETDKQRYWRMKDAMEARPKYAMETLPIRNLLCVLPPVSREVSEIEQENLDDKAAGVEPQTPQSQETELTPGPVAVKMKVPPVEVEMPEAAEADGADRTQPSQLGRTMRLDLGHGVKLTLREIPAGEFRMGSPPGEGEESEKPQHTVKLPRSFYMGIYPVTEEQYGAVTRRKSESVPARARHPVTNISWHAAIDFCAKLSKKTGKRVRLPSEAEWEYACRAGTQSAYWFGDDAAELSRHAWCVDNSNGHTHPVDKRTSNRNAWGLYDMHGNVWEWCQDHWHENYDMAPSDGSAWDFDGAPNSRVVRGGSWQRYRGGCRSASRDGTPMKHNSAGIIGFRVVCEPKVDTSQTEAGAVARVHVSGSGFTESSFHNGAKAVSNRDYV